MEELASVKTLETKQRLKLKDETVLHPIQQLEKSSFRCHEHIKNTIITNVFGSHMPIRLRMEKKILSSFRRLPVLKSEFSGLESITQKDSEIGFEDYLDGTFMPEVALQDVHVLMERELGMDVNMLH